MLKDVRRCVELLKAAGLEVIVVEITTPDIREIGMRVVRVLIPGMVPLHGVYKFPFLGSKRLAQFPMLGSSNQGNGHGPQDFNKYPHPFP